MGDFNNKDIIYYKKNGLEYIQFKRLLEYESKVKHAICFKPMDFNSNNVSSEKLNYNYKMVCEEIGLGANKIVQKNQTHSKNVEIITNENKNEFFDDTDVFITKEKNISLPIITADCLACLIYDPVNNIIANVHSGWRGTVSKIIRITVEKMISNYKSNPKDIICCMAPSILKCHFEVKQDVKDIFEKTFKKMLNKDIIIKNNDRFFIDTILINRLLLLDLGLKNENIIESNICTFHNSNKFHSYRKEKEKSGRNLNIIGLV